MAVIGRVTAAAVLWLVAFVVADLQAPAPDDPREDVTVRVSVEAPTAGPVETRDVAVTNARSRPVVLAAAAADAGDAAPGCPASLVTRAAPRDAVEVPPGATVVVPVDVRLDPAAPAACHDRAWPLELAATAVGPDAGADPADDGPGLLPYVIATTGVLALAGIVLLGAAAAGRRRSATQADAGTPRPSAPVVGAGARRPSPSFPHSPAPPSPSATPSSRAAAGRDPSRHRAAPRR